MAFTVSRRIAAILSALLLAAAAATVAAPPATGHSYLRSSKPADGAVLERAPRQVVLNFTDPLIDTGAAVTVAGPDGGARLAAELSGDRVTAAWPADWDSGSYRVTYRVVGEDGHVMNGSVSFRIASAGTAAPQSAVQESDSGVPAADAATSPGSVPVWVWVLGGVAVAAGLVVALSRRGGGSGG